MHDEILEHVFANLTIENRGRAACVCRQWRKASFADISALSLGGEFVFPSLPKARKHLLPWLNRHGKKVRAIQIERSHWPAEDSKLLLLNAVLRKCPLLRSLQVTLTFPIRKWQSTFAPLANLVSCSITLAESRSKQIWRPPFGFLKNLEHLMLTAEGATVFVKELPPVLKTFGCTCAGVAWDPSVRATNLEVFTVEQSPAVQPMIKPGFPGLNTSAAAVSTLCIKANLSETIGIHELQNWRSVKRLVLHETCCNQPPTIVDLSMLTGLQDAVLLGPFRLRGVPKSLERLAMACVGGHYSAVPLIVDRPRLKVISLSKILSQRKQPSLAQGCVVLRDRAALFVAEDKGQQRGQSVDARPVDTLMHDLDLQPSFLDAWEALWHS